MNNFQKQFVLNMFLDSDASTVINRLVVAMANIVNENNENMSIINNLMNAENITDKSKAQRSVSPPFSRSLKGFYEQTILNFTDEEYIANFEMKKNTVQALITFLKDHISSGTVPLEKKVHIFLWYLVNDGSFNEVGKLFRLHKSSVSYIFQEIATVLYENMNHFISWPSKEEQHVTRIKVNSRFKFPNCVGFIDACRFKVVSKRNKRGHPEIILLQAVCDENLMFTDIHIGAIGQTKKGKLYKESQLANELKKLVEFENHILGGPEYRLKNNLITPFTSDELLTSEEMKFNETHWKTRCYVGQAFERLKEKFRKLNHIDTVKPESVELLIAVSCILHNFILGLEGCSEVKEEVVSYEEGITINKSIVENADEKRQFLCNYINFIDAEDLM